MKVALVHDYLREWGGAERVLKVLSDMYPEAKIYTAFRVRGSTADKELIGKIIIESKWAWLLKWGKFYSPLRFLAPWVWRSFDLSEYDLVITSASWYITRGFRVGKKTKVICYCHTPPRYLYGYETSVGWTKYKIVRLYAAIVNHFLRLYDFEEAQKIDYWIANSINVQERIAKFYRKQAVVIYPPIEVTELMAKSKNEKKEEYFLIVSRLVGAKGLIEAAKAVTNWGYKLKISGEAHGFSRVKSELEKINGVELLGRVADEQLWKLYGKAKGFIALARDEDFGMTVVEAMACGTPVIAFNGGGFKESVVNGVTGILVDETDEESMAEAIDKFNKIKWSREKLLTQAKKFSKERFIEEFEKYINKHE